MKKSLVTIISTLLITNFANAQVIDVKPGWNLLGATENISSLTAFSSDCTASLWTYGDGAWSTYVPGQSSNTLSSIAKGKGFWASMKSCSKTQLDTASSTTPVTLDDKTREVSKFVVLMGNTYDDVGSGAGGALSGVNTVTSSSTFTRKVTRADLGQFKYNSDGSWTGTLGQTIVGVDPALTMHFLRAATGAVIVEDITQVSNYIDVTTGALGPLVDLASGTQPDLKKMNIKITVDMGSSPLSVSGASVVLEPLVTTIPMTTGAMPDNVTFETTGVLTIADGTTLDMKNVKINMNPNSPTQMNGTYDFSKSYDGDVYSGTATFDQTGCTGANVYKGAENVGVIKIVNGEFRLQGPNGEFDEVISLQ